MLSTFSRVVCCHGNKASAYSEVGFSVLLLSGELKKQNLKNKKIQMPSCRLDSVTCSGYI